MPYQSTEIEGVFLFTPQVFEDSRGHFFESFRKDKTLEETGFNFEVKQVNTSISKRGVLRGIHFKKNPPGQAKFVSVTSGSTIDVVFDLRKSSPTFGKWQAFRLTSRNLHSLFVGNGIGHAFLATEDQTQVSYLCDSVFQPELEHGINPLSAGISWHSLAKHYEITEFRVSERDQKALNFQDAEHLFFD